MLNISSNTSYSLTAVHSPNKHFQKNIVSHQGFFGIHFKSQKLQKSLTLILQIFVDSVNFIVHTCDTNILLSATERNSKVTSVCNFFSSKFWSLLRRVLKVLCSYCPINDSSVCFKLPFTLQLWYKPLGIVQMITKTQRIHISKDDGFANFTTSTLLKIGSGFPRVAGIRPSMKKYLVWQVIGILFPDCSPFTKYTFAGNHRFPRRFFKNPL